MSGTVVIVIVVLSILVVVGGSILVLVLNRREYHTPSDTHQANKDGDLPPTGDQRLDSEKFILNGSWSTNGATLSSSGVEYASSYEVLP